MVLTPEIEAPEGLEIQSDMSANSELMLGPEALEFLIALHERFNEPRKRLLRLRQEKQKLYQTRDFPSFPEETEHIRTSSWLVNPVPTELQDRRVELVGGISRDCITQGLESKAKVYIADFESAHRASWESMLEGQINLAQALKRAADNKKEGHLSRESAGLVLFLKPRGLHLEEHHITVYGRPMSAALVDFGLYFFHNAYTLLDQGSAPYFYLPKLESHHEAKLWNDIFVFSQTYLGIPIGTVKATVIVETLPAAFELNEILYVLKEHSAGMSCDRWDFAFSLVKKFKSDGRKVLPDLNQLDTSSASLEAFANLVVQTCHRRGTHAIGGFTSASCSQKFQEEKFQEISSGHDGTWVGNEVDAGAILAVYGQHMNGYNQTDNKRKDININAEDLIKVPTGTITEEGIRENISTCLQFLESCHRGLGLFHETIVEIQRAQLWHWVRHQALTVSGLTIDENWYQKLKGQEVEKIAADLGEETFQKRHFQAAAETLDNLVLSAELPEFLSDCTINQLPT